MLLPSEKVGGTEWTLIGTVNTAVNKDVAYNFNDIDISSYDEIFVQDMRTDSANYYINISHGVLKNAPSSKTYMLFLVYSAGIVIGTCRIKNSNGKRLLNAYIANLAITANDTIQIYAK